MDGDVSAVILAGGSGRRMGGMNKALLQLSSSAFIECQLRVCSGWTDDIVVVSNDPAFSRQLTERYGVSAVPDLYPGEGPLAGLQAGLSAIHHPSAWVMACDQPLVNAAAASYMYERMRIAGVWAAVPVLNGHPQPLHAVYRREAAAITADMLRLGERRLTALFDRISWVAISGDEFEQNGMRPDFADDVDTPEDYDRIRSRMDVEGV